MTFQELILTLCKGRLLVIKGFRVDKGKDFSLLVADYHYSVCKLTSWFSQFLEITDCIVIDPSLLITNLPTAPAI